MSEVVGESNSVSTDAVLGTNAIPGGTAAGVHGVSKNAGPGVLGESVDGRGVQGISVNNYGVRAHSDNLAGLRASSKKVAAIEGWGSEGVGVFGKSDHSNGVHGLSEKEGVHGESTGGRGVAGFSSTGNGVYGRSESQSGIVGESQQWDGVFGISHDPNHAGISGHNWDQHGNRNQGGLAGWFGGKVVVDGDVEVTGDIRLTNADLAEDFTVHERSEPGEIMVLTETGILEPCTKAYDKRVAGVISGAGDYKPGIVMDKRQVQANRQPIALMGKVYCRVDAQFGAIEIGDLLTTSSTPGHAMKTTDPFKAFGAVIGKALKPLQTGQGLIPILIALQ